MDKYGMAISIMEDINEMEPHMEAYGLTRAPGLMKGLDVDERVFFFVEHKDSGKTYKVVMERVYD